MNRMLERVKLAKRIQTSVFDAELLDLITAAIADIRHAGARFEVTEIYDEYSDELTDYEIADPLVSRAVVTYCVMNFGSPDDYDRLKASYDEQKGQLRESSDYGMEVVG